MSMIHIMGSYNSTIEANWEVDDNGFLRVKARVLSAGVMDYAPEEMGDVPPAFSHLKTIPVLTAADDISNPRSLRSLEGVAITAFGHDWQTTGESKQVGAVAGSAVMDGVYLNVDLLITDEKCIEAIKGRSLIDISAAYGTQVVWQEGAFETKPYVARQTEIRYNHIALLPVGHGRAGTDVRILNEQTKQAKQLEIEMSELTSCKLPITGVSIQVANANDSVLIQNESEKAADVAKSEAMNAADEMEKKHKEAMENMAAENAEKMKKLEAENAELKEKLENAMSPENMAKMAENMSAERDEAKKVLQNARVANELPDDLKALNGHALRAEVVKRVRVQNGLPPLSDEQISDESHVAGRFSVMVETSGYSKPTVTGANIINTDFQNRTVGGGTSKERLHHLYKKKQETK